VWLISPRMSVQLLMVSEYQSLTLYTEQVVLIMNASVSHLKPNCHQTLSLIARYGSGMWQQSTYHLRESEVHFEMWWEGMAPSYRQQIWLLNICMLHFIQPLVLTCST